MYMAGPSPLPIGSDGSPKPDAKPFAPHFEKKIGLRFRLWQPWGRRLSATLAASTAHPEPKVGLAFLPCRQQLTLPDLQTSGAAGSGITPSTLSTLVASQPGS
jgi:hypothetical protein